MTETAYVQFRAGIGGEPIVEAAVSSSAHSFAPAPWGARIIGGAGHPVAGDQFGLKVGVGVGCCAEIRSHTPTVARRGRSGPGDPGPVVSSTEIHITVASDAMFTWGGEPSIATQGCEHLSDATVRLASNARLMWRDEFILDRRPEETPGTWRSRLRVTRDSWPVICSDLALGPGSPLWDSPVGLERARAVSLLVVVDPSRPAEGWTSTDIVTGSGKGVALPLSTPGVQIVAWGDDLFDCRSAVEKMMLQCEVPAWVQARWRGGPGPVMPDPAAAVVGAESA